MATREELSLALDDVIYLTGVHRSMLINAAEYQLRLAEGQDPAVIGQLIKDNAARYKILLGKRQVVRDEQGQLLANGLDGSGIDPVAHDELFQGLIAQADVDAKSAIADIASLESYRNDFAAAVKQPSIDIAAIAASVAP